MEELRKKFLLQVAWLTSLSKSRGIFLTLLFGVILVGFGVFFFKSGLGSPSTKVEVLEATTESQGNREMVVEIAGEVEKPGVYKLPGGSRVDDLLVVSGGLGADANREWVEKYLNRAATLVDSQKIYIPSQSEALSAKETGGDQSISANFSGQGSGLININTASLPELDKLPGIGPVYGQSIIDHRPYSTNEELVSKGALKKSVYEKIKDLVSVY